MPRLSTCPPLQSPARRLHPLAVALFSVLACAQANADDASSDGNLRPVQLDAVQVKAEAALRKPLDAVPGGTNLIELDDARIGRTAGTQDVLAYQPGVFAQSPGNEGTKLSIRGSGINRAPGAHGSGVTVMLDGLPLSEPGGTPYELLEPLWARRVEILRGANGFERGGLSLGGVVDYLTRDGRNAAPLQLHLEAGSRGYRKFAASTGGQKGALDGYLGWADTRFDGWQRHASGNGKGVVANVGWQIDPDVETRFYLRYRDTFHLTPGRLTRAQIRHDPEAANAVNLADDARRPQPGSIWLANKTTWRIDDASSLVAGLAYHDYPMDLQESSYRQRITYADLNAVLDYRHRHRLWGLDSVTTLGMQVLHDLPGNRVRETLRFPRNGYPAGTLDREYVHRGTNSQLRLGNDLALSDAVHLQTGLALLHARRSAWVRWPVTAEHVGQSQNTWAPRLGLTWQTTPQLQWFGNLSRSLEPPHPWSMIWDSNRYFDASQGPAAGRQSQAVRLDNQTATTLELGGRGEAAFGHWQLSVYQSHVSHELLSVLVGQGADAYMAESNASPTRHRGIEAGLDSTVWQGDAARLSLRQAYTFSDFRYRDDARFGRNRLPGLPRHYYQGELRLDTGTGVSVALNTEYASRMPVDYANSFHADAHLIFGAELGYAPVGNRWNGWLQLRNLGDRRYAGTVTPGYDDGGQDMARSTPGEGFGIYAGMAWRWE